VEAVYQELKGVEQIVSGYAGGAVENPTYQQVCTGSTGHAEVAQITYDPETISYEDVLYVFWRTHDPTTLNRQGGDVGTQYRSIILYHDEEQKATAERSKRETDASDLWPNPIVTEIAPLGEFYPAEDYHQDYYRNNRFQPYCLAVIDPKIKKFRKEFGSKIKASE
jgi:peptide-methionine (S)-S-oxide reductase